MAYHTKVLLPDEQVRYVGKLHWVIYARAWFSFILSAVLGVEGLRLRSDDAVDYTGAYVSWGDLAWMLGALSLALWLIQLLSAWIRQATTEIVVTDRRVIFKEGFIRRRTLEMNMNKVETVDVMQSITGRIFNYGTIMIRGTGSSYEPLRLIADPIGLRTAIVAG